MTKKALKFMWLHIKLKIVLAAGTENYTLKIAIVL